MKTPYKIFLSFSSAEVELAEQIRNILNDAFVGKITFYFSKDQLLGGSSWKSEIQNALKEYQAILTIMTPRYLDRPWAYIEWSSFWINDKPAFVVVTDDVKIDEIIDPMRDRQVTMLFDEDSVTRLIQGICDEDATNISPIPYSCVSDIVYKSKAVYDKILANDRNQKYSIYKDSPELLPEDDNQKVDILWYFFREKDRDTFKDVFQRINDNSVKTSVLITLLVKYSELDLIAECYEMVDNKVALGALVRKLVENGFESSTLTEKIVEYCSSSQTTIRSFGEYLIKNGHSDLHLLHIISEQLKNNVELRKLAEVLIDQSLVDSKPFDKVIRIFKERRADKPLSQLIEYLIESKKFSPTSLEVYLTYIAKNSEKDAQLCMEKLIRIDCKLAKKLVVDLKIIKGPEIYADLIRLLRDVCGYEG